MAKSKYDLGGLLDELEKSDSSSGTQNGDYQSDFWKPTLEKGEERAEYVIRFLPNLDSKTSAPWIERAAHMFNFPSGKFIYEPCGKKANGDPCYICEEVSEMYKSGDMELEEMGAKRFSKKRVFHNVLIVSDPRDGGKNEGKVMIYECGKQIHNKCIEFLKNKDLDPEERMYFHPTEGTNFRMVMTWKMKYQNYDSSDFLRKPSALEVEGESLTMKKAEAFIDENCYSLNERLMGEKAFKDYDTLKGLYLNQGVKTEDPKPSKKKEEEEIDETIENEKVEARNPEKKEKVKAETKKSETKKSEPEDAPFDTEDENLDEDAELEALLG
jgi:hypothetical protein